MTHLYDTSLAIGRSRFGFHSTLLIGLLIAWSVVAFALPAAAAVAPERIEDGPEIKPALTVEPGQVPADSSASAGAARGTVTDEYGRGIWATVSIGESTLTTPDGTFSIDAEPGTLAYEVVTLFGTYRGEAIFDGTGDIAIALPIHESYGTAMEPHLEEAIDIMTVQNSAGQRHDPQRWQRGRELKVWVEPYDDGTQELAMQAFSEWQKALRDTITFVETTDKEAADLTVEYVSFHSLGGPGGFSNGLCRRRISQGYLSRGEILIVNHLSSDITVHLHEIGHCLGLGHNPFGGQLMSPVAAGQAITREEAGIVRALYSWPAGPHWTAD